MAAAQAALQPTVVPPQPPQSPTSSKSDWSPTSKVGVGALAGGLTVLIMTFMGPPWERWYHQAIPATVGAAITNILTFAIQYWVPDRK